MAGEKIQERPTPSKKTTKARIAPPLDVGYNSSMPKSKPFRPAAATFLLVLCFLGLSGLVYLGTSNFLRHSFGVPKQYPPYAIQGFYGNIKAYSSVTRNWITPKRSGLLGPGDSIRTGKDSEMDLQFEDAYVRLKPDSELEIEQPDSHAPASANHLRLKRGQLLVSSLTQQIPISGPHAGWREITVTTSASGSVISASAEPGKPFTAGILKGDAVVRPGLPWARAFALRELEKLESEGARARAVQISQKEWREMQEAYELRPKSAADEARQLDLSKMAGNLFQVVFDHGTFFTPKSGFCEREFIQTPDGETYLDVEYDVFPRDAFVGVYFKTRDFDLSKYKSIQFDVRRREKSHYPEHVLFEFKSKYKIMRSIAIKHVDSDWSTLFFPLKVEKEMPINEITMLFTHEKVGADKRGAIELRHFKLDPDPDEVKREAQEAASKAADQAAEKKEKPADKKAEKKESAAADKKEEPKKASTVSRKVSVNPSAETSPAATVLKPAASVPKKPTAPAVTQIKLSDIPVQPKSASENGHE